METKLGWGIVGVIGHSDDIGVNPIGHSHRLAAKQLTGSQIGIQKHSKEAVAPAGRHKRLDMNNRRSPKRRRRRKKATNK